LSEHPPDSTGVLGEETNEASQQGKCRRCMSKTLWGLLQQEEAHSLLPLWLFAAKSQAVCAVLTSVLFILMGASLLSISSAMIEVEPISYSASDIEKEFSIDTQINRDVLVYYDLPGMWANRKQIVENKDPEITRTLMGEVKCIDAENQDALWRRGCDVEKRQKEGGKLRCPHDIPFEDLMNNIGDTQTFKPCGLMALTMFLDEFQFARLENGGWGDWINVSEDDIALPGEVGSNSKVYGPFIVPDNKGGFTVGEEKKKSWLKAGSFFEHFKVWYRPPAAPHVRNLWGRIKGPLPAGRYKVNFRKNSAIWTEKWGLQEKRVVLAGEHPFGSKGAAKCLGVFSIILGSLEVLMATVFLLKLGVHRTPGVRPF